MSRIIFTLRGAAMSYQRGSGGDSEVGSRVAGVLLFRVFPLLKRTTKASGYLYDTLAARRETSFRPLTLGNLTSISLVKKLLLCVRPSH